MPAVALNFDPIVFMDTYTPAIANQIYDRLFDIDEFNIVKPKLVSTWETNTDGTIYSICLKNNVLFHNNKPLTSNDVVFTIKRVISKKSFLSHEFSIIKGAQEYQDGRNNTVSGLQVISPTCLAITLVKNYPLFINMLAISGTEILPDKLDEKNEHDFFLHPVGTGPFNVIKFEPGQYVELAAHEKYFLGKPKLSILIYEKTTSDNAMHGFNKGYYQDLERFDPQTTELSVNYSVIKTPISKTDTLIFNIKRFPFDNLHFRRAISYAIDKKTLVNSCFPGNIIARGYIPPGLAGYNKNMFDYEFNPQTAKEELSLSKLPKKIFTKPIKIFRPDNYSCRDVFKKLLEANLKKIGLNTEVVYIPYSDLMVKFNSREFEMIDLSFTGDFPEAILMLNNFRSNSNTNFSGFSSPQIDNFLNIAGSSSDRYQRYQAYETIQKILYENAVTVNLHYNILSIIYQPNVMGYVPSPLGTFYTSMWPVYIEEDEK